MLTGAIAFLISLKGAIWKLGNPDVDKKNLWSSSFFLNTLK